MTGAISSEREALMRVFIYGHNNERAVELSALIDTGFTEFLSLPYEIIQELELPRSNLDTFTLSDGSQMLCTVHRAEIRWHGKRIVIDVHSGEQALVGMALLEGSDVALRVRFGGEVTIVPIP